MRWTPQQSLFPQSDFDGRGAYEFADILASSHLTPNEPFSLMNRPIEDVHLVPPQAPLQNNVNSPNFPALRTSPYGCQWGADTADSCHIPLAPHQEGMLSASISRWEPAVAPCNPTSSSSTPRACLPPMGNLAYAPPAPVPAATVGFSNTPSNHVFWPSLLGAPSHTSSYHEAPPLPNPIGANVFPHPAPTPPYPAQASAMFGHSGFVPEADTIGTRYGSGGSMAGYIPAKEFQPLRLHEQSRLSMSTSSQPGSSRKDCKLRGSRPRSAKTRVRGSRRRPSQTTRVEPMQVTWVIKQP
ncbi:hypothetical protein DENSPDRAFT_887374 [Dentipellis sp. KUC8613]|nr:hypothetical protein DENSPDRAFT_887374 [Dentipellis sp. KUC8613]